MCTDGLNIFQSEKQNGGYTNDNGDLGNIKITFWFGFNPRIIPDVNLSLLISNV